MTNPEQIAYVAARCCECGEVFEVPVPERLGDRVYWTCPSCNFPLTARWYGATRVDWPTSGHPEQATQQQLLIDGTMSDG